MKSSVLILLSVVLLWGCKKDTTDPTPTEEQESLVQLSTSFGEMYLWLHKETPLHRANFLKLANDGYFNGTTFHRCVTNFVIQGGDPNSKDSDPNNDGQGGPNYTVPAEILDTFVHVRGSIGAARKGDNVNPNRESNGSQFYIVLENNAGTASLDGKYTVFGTVLMGMNVADQIVQQAKNANDRPLTDIPMTVKVITRTKEQLKTEFGLEL